ncbi:MAG: hypothetical protein V7722_06780, partial [Porticoccus sp.]
WCFQTIRGVRKIAHFQTFDTGVTRAGNMVFVWLDFYDLRAFSGDNETALRFTYSTKRFVLFHDDSFDPVLFRLLANQWLSTCQDIAWH